MSHEQIPSIQSVLSNEGAGVARVEGVACRSRDCFKAKGEGELHYFFVTFVFIKR